jgi:hypothetical protein
MQSKAKGFMNNRSQLVPVQGFQFNAQELFVRNSPSGHKPESIWLALMTY